jgi:hypothetical protein
VDTGHVQYLISYVLRGDVEESDYDAWVRATAIPWWTNQPGFRSIRGFYTVVGHEARIFAEIDVDHMESLAKTLASREYGEMRRELNRFAEGVDARILVPTGRAR